MIIDAFGPLIYRSEISKDFLSYLKTVSLKSKDSEDVGWSLAGNIENQKLAKANPQKFINFIYPHVVEYILANIDRAEKNALAYSRPSLNQVTFDLGNGPWINYQKKHEFNPVHKHSGNLSSVIFIDIPEEIENELENWNGKSNCPSPGMLEFIYNSHTFMCANAHKIIPKTGDMLIFPADLKHCVYPFTSDVTRITMSFNIFNLQYD